MIDTTKKPQINKSKNLRANLDGSKYSRYISQEFNQGAGIIIQLSARIEIYSYMSFRQINSVTEEKADVSCGNFSMDRSTQVSSYLNSEQVGQPGTKATIIARGKISQILSVTLKTELKAAGFEVGASSGTNIFYYKNFDLLMNYSVY